MQEEFEDSGAIGSMASFEVVDLLVALGPHCLRHQIVHAHNQHVFVVRAIEDGDFAPFGYLRFDAPQKVVRQFFLGWLFEAGDAAAGGIHGADDVLDYAIFAAGIEACKQTSNERFRSAKSFCCRSTIFLQSLIDLAAAFSFECRPL